MDIAALSMEKAQSDLQARAGVAVLAKGMDAMREQGAALAKLLDSVPLPEGSGANIDTFA